MVYPPPPLTAPGVGITGRIIVPDVHVLACASRGRPCTDEAQFTFSPFTHPRPKHPDLEALIDEHIEPLRKRIETAGGHLTNEACVDVREAHLQYIDDVPTYVFTPAVSHYFPFAATSARLDAQWPVGGTSTLREYVGGDPATLNDIKGLPFVAKVGVGVAAVTSDGHLVLAARTRHAVASTLDSNTPQVPVGFVAEGAAPTDKDGTVFHPKVTAMRGLLEEYAVAGVIPVPIGVFFDRVRWQFCFMYLAELDLTLDELRVKSRDAIDGWEASQLTQVPWDAGSPQTQALMLGTHDRFTLASNHTSATLWFALAYRHGEVGARRLLEGKNVPESVAV